MRVVTVCAVALLSAVSFAGVDGRQANYLVPNGPDLGHETPSRTAQCGSVAKLPMRVEGRSCTSFCLDNKGEAVFGSNYDNDIPEGMVFINKRGVSKSGLMPGTTGQVATWTSKYASVTFTVVGHQLAWAGMNEQGLVMSTMALGETQNPEPDERAPLHSPHWMQYLLDNCSSVNEILAADSQVRIFETVDHYLVSDAAGDCAVIEFLDGKTVMHTGQGLPAAVLTNSTYAESAALLDGSGGESGKRRDPQPINGSLRRFGIAAERVQAFEPAGAEDAVTYAFDILDKVGGDATLWSIVFDTHDLTVYFRTKSHRAIRYLSLNDFDLSCQAPDLMLDIHEKLEGHIAEAMTVFSSDRNFAFLKNAIARREIPMSDEQLQAMRAILDSYECEQ